MANGRVTRFASAGDGTLNLDPGSSMEFRCGAAVVRPFALDDAEGMALNANNRAVWLNLRDLFPHPYRREDAERYIELVQRQSQPTSFAIAVDGSAVGGISLRPGEDVERISAELGYWLGEPYWGRGITTAAVKAVTAYAFTTLDLVRVFAVPFANNRASARVLEKAGYLHEGRLRSSAIKNGQVLDQDLFARIRPGAYGGA